MLDRNEYLDRLNALQRRLRQLIRDVMKDAQLERVHDMRTTLRRLQVVVSLLPRSGRRSDYLESLKGLSKASREVRDVDVIAQRLHAHTGTRLEEVHSVLSTQREGAIEKMRALLSEFDGTEILFKPGKQKKGRVGEAHEKAIRKAERKLAGLLPLISRENVDIEDLHEFRKTGRRLRYLLELTVSKGRIRTLTRIQDRLGELRDIDLAISFLSRCSATDSIRAVVDSEKGRRSLLLKGVGAMGREAIRGDREKT